MATALILMHSVNGFQVGEATHGAIVSGPTTLFGVSTVYEVYDLADINYSFRFEGTGLNDVGGILDQGTITSFSVVNNANTQMTITGLSMPAAGINPTMDSTAVLFSRLSLNNKMILGGTNGEDQVNMSTSAFDFTEHTAALGAGNDTYDGTSVVDTVRGDDGNDVIYAAGGNDMLYGGDDDDFINGGADTDNLFGDMGNDTLDGDAGNDSHYGGAGDDTFLANGGTNRFDGGAGTDTVNYQMSEFAGTAWDITIDSGGAAGSDTSGDTFVSIEGLVAGEVGDAATDDVLTISNVVNPGDVSGLDNNAVGTFTTPSTAVTPFGPSGTTLMDILMSGMQGTVQITSGDESGTIGGMTFSNFETINFAISCFLTGTAIDTPSGPRPVEELAIGDPITTQDGRSVAVKWIGRQTIFPHFRPAERLRPVRVAAGALGEKQPLRDLYLTAEHGLLIDGVVCAAGALLNGRSITRVPLSGLGESYTVYHIETEGHEVILAEGAPAETYVDNGARSAFDNYAEFLDLYGEPPETADLPYPRAMTARQVPARIRTLLDSAFAA